MQGKIQINTGTWTTDCVADNDLAINSSKYPAVRNFLEYVSQRSLSTLLTSGSVTPFGVTNPNKSKLPSLDKAKGIGNNGYQYNVMGRIERATAITSQVGASQPDGTFVLKMVENYLHKGDVVVFHGQRLQALVMTQPSGSPAMGYTYTFKTQNGTVFAWATHVAPQPGTKTCMPSYSAFGEKSLKGYGRSKFPDTFINFTTIQRKTSSITGGAASNVLWYKYTAENAEMTGWMYQQLVQDRATWAMEDERAKWFGVSNMKNSDGSVKSTPDTFDLETGMPIITGDGWEMQVAGGNVVLGSASNGDWTLQDLKDIMAALELESDKVNGVNWVAVTGTKGYALVQELAVQLAGNQNVTFMQNVTQDGRPVDSGYEFNTLKIAGNTITFIKHTLFDDRLMFTELDSDGFPLQSSTAFIMNIGVGNQLNMEILHKEGNGINRSNVNAKINGMTGSNMASVTSEEDAMKYAMLKEDMLVLYNAQCCGILRKQAV